MGLQITNYPNPYSTTPAPTAYAWVTLLAIDFSSGNGRIELAVNQDAASADALLPPIDRIGVPLGSTLVQANPQATPPTQAVMFPTLSELMSDANFAQAFGYIRQVLYTHLKNHPKLAGATDA